MAELAFKQKGQRLVLKSLGGEQEVPNKKISIAVPASVVSDTPHLREKTSKIGLVGRAAAIFRIDEIVIYPDNPRTDQTEETDLIATLLSYMETPQYLRKRLFKLQPNLQYAGILPPLRTPHHPLNDKIKNLAIGEHREGVTLSRTAEGTLVDIGVEHSALIVNKQLPINKRVTVKVTSNREQVEAELANRAEIQTYWGYSVLVEKRGFGELVRNRDFDMTVATSRYGTPFSDVANNITDKWRNATTLLIAFGAPTKGLHEIVRQQRLNLGEIMDFVVNIIPSQGTETVRTEEALIASLAILNIYLDFCPHVSIT